ncbi:type IV pilin protein [Thermodesulfobacteriota bacterium]
MRRKDRHLLRRKSGFTLVELMVSLGVIAVLAAIAIPTASRYYKLARRIECQISIINFLRAQDFYFLENNTYYPLQAGQTGKVEKKIAWGKDDPLPDDPDNYHFPELGVEFLRDSHRRYKIKYEHKVGSDFKQELKLELKTDEDFDNDGMDNYYSYKKKNWQNDDGSGTDGKWDIYNNFWFEINGIPAFSDVLPSES